MRISLFALSALLCLAGCDGGPDPGDDGGPLVDSGQPRDSGTAIDSGTPVDSGSPVDSGGEVDAGGFTLTVNNIFNWCNVSVNGGASSTVATQTINVAPNTVVPLTATAATGFIWDYGWDGTDADPGTGATEHDTNMVTMVTVTENTTVRVCCPFPDGTGCD